MINLNRILDGLVADGTVANIAVRVGNFDGVICDAFRGDVCETTLFDMASVTKVMATTSLALIALARGHQGGSVIKSVTDEKIHP